MIGNGIVYPPAVVTPGTTFLQQAKTWLIATVGLEKDALHVYFALLVLFGSALLFRWRLGSWKPLALIFAFSILGEIWDLRDGLLTSVPLTVGIVYSLHDIWNTMFWPLTIMLLARYTRLFGRECDSDGTTNPNG